MYFGIPLSSHLIPDPPSSSYFPQLCVFFHFKLIEFNLCCQLLRVESWPRMWPQGSCHKSSLARDGILCSLACLQAGTSSDLIIWCLVHCLAWSCDVLCMLSQISVSSYVHLLGCVWKSWPEIIHHLWLLQSFYPIFHKISEPWRGVKYTCHLGLAIQLFFACWPVEHLLIAIYWKKLLWRRLRNPYVKLLKDG